MVSLDSKQWVNARDVAVAVLEATGRIDLLDPNAARWLAIWNGETIEQDGIRRNIRSLRAKLIESAVEEFPPPETSRLANNAAILLDYIYRCEKGSHEDPIPNHSGSPIWIPAEDGRLELWFKWHFLITRAWQRFPAEPPPKEQRQLRSAILEKVGKAEFTDRKKEIDKKTGRWIIWTETEIEALEKIATEIGRAHV